MEAFAAPDQNMMLKLHAVDAAGWAELLDKCDLIDRLASRANR